jgi:SOS-response transcriptional repressor LexA
MDTVQRIRHTNLLQLITELGSIQALADRIERSPSHVSQMKNNSTHSRTGIPRGIGDKMARHIEEKMGRPRGWMDTQHSDAGLELSIGVVAQVLSQGPAEYAVLLTWTALMTTTTPLPALFRVAAPDDSMAPRVRAGEIVEFSTTETPRPGDGVLVRTAQGGLYFRRYRQAHGDAWEAYPVNEAYRTLASDRDELTLVAVLVGIPSQRWS